MSRGIILLIVAFHTLAGIHAQDFKSPDTVSIQSGSLILKALLLHPSGHGPFAAGFLRLAVMDGPRLIQIW